MKKLLFILLTLAISSCGDKVNSIPEVQRIVDRSIADAGGDLYATSNISFDFRDRSYLLRFDDGQRIMKRILKSDSIKQVDVLKPKGFQRIVNDSVVQVSDSMANVYSNSINSVHYFAYLPFGLNDPAVNKELLGEIRIKDIDYYKVKVTFDEKGGGDDFEDIYIYWFNKETYKPDYLAYEFHTEGGGMRFRKAYNERYVNGLRFVDYDNFRTKDSNTSILNIDSLYLQNKLKPLSKIELKNIKVDR